MDWKRFQKLAAPGRKVLAGLAQAGDDKSARKLMTLAMGALANVINDRKVLRADKEALFYLHQSLKEYLIDELPLERAFCVEKEHRKRGAPKKPAAIVGDAIVWRKVANELDSQVSHGEKPSVESAQQHVAQALKVSERSVRSGWQENGGLKKYKKDLRQN